jgi:ribonuclease Z
VDLDIVFLGTSGSVPTARRGLAGTLVRRGGDRILFDCGEGTQRQLLRSSVGLVELPEVFLTHYHADHYLGLPGMLKTFALRGRELPLTVYGPPGLVELFTVLKRIFGKLTYEVDLIELRPGDVLDRGDYRIFAFPVEHGVSANGYALAETPRPGRFDVEGATALGVPAGPLFGQLQSGQPIQLPAGDTVTPDQVLGPPRPGRRIVIAGDTRPAAAVLDAAHDADVLVHEATFATEEAERAEETLHATAVGAAELARAAGVKMLVLTHLSNRYFGPEIAREARAVFPETVVPRDFDIIDVRFPERGGPRLVKGGALGRGEETDALGNDGAGGGSGGPGRGGGDPDDLALGRNPVGARAGGRAAPDATR